MSSNIAKGILDGNPRAIAKGISAVERGGEAGYEILHEIYGRNQSYILGVTGPAGAGKSSLINALIPYLKQRYDKIGILTVDPSSPFSGGAILGDRIRMQDHATDDKVFIRSMASRGHLGGVSAATKDAINVLEAAGFDLIIVETVGIGQDEIEIINLSDTTLLIQVPGMGDDIQVMKSGVMEIGDIFVVNKADREGADRIVRYLRSMLEENYGDSKYIPPVVPASATNGKGLENVLSAIVIHHEYIVKTGEIEELHAERIEDDIESVLQLKIDAYLREYLDFDYNMSDWIDQILSGRETPYSLVNRLGDEIIRAIRERR